MKRNVEVLVLTDNNFFLNENQLARIKSVSPVISVSMADKSGPDSPLLETADVIYGFAGKSALKKAKNLKWLHLSSAGVDGYLDRSLYNREDFILTNSSGVFGIQISEHVLGMILAFNRDLHIYIRNQQKKIWDRKFPIRNFYGSTIGIIGLGDIGSQLAKRSHELGARVVAVKRTPSERPSYVDELYGEDGIDRLLSQSDYVVLALPATEKTKGMIGAERLAMMKKDALLINIGRGSLVDQDALIRALKENRIGGAGLDVTSPEPLPPESELWELPNVIISPHTSGLSPVNNETSCSIFCDNLKRFLEGKTLNNIVDFKEGY